MTDIEMLELAAKAVGYIDDTKSDSVEYGLHRDEYDIFYYTDETGWTIWNPRDDDGDAFRLAVKLGIVLSPSNVSVIAWVPGVMDRDSVLEPLGTDPCAATRLAVLRAAAEIGRAMP